MSAFVVSEKTMTRVVTALCARNRYGHILPMFGNIGTDAPDAPTKIGRLLFSLNIEAVTQRYPDCEDDQSNMPGTVGCQSLPMTFSCRSGHYLSVPSLIDGYKAIRCLIYQCSEGDVPERAAVYRWLVAASGVIAGEIVSNTPEYEAAEW